MGVPPTPCIDGAAGLSLWLPGAAVANDIARSQTRPLNDEPNVGRKGRMQSAANGKERRDGSHAYPGGTRAKTEVGKGADKHRLAIVCPHEAIIKGDDWIGIRIDHFSTRMLIP